MVLLVSPAAWARCPSSDMPFVVLITRVKPPDQLIADQLRRHLEASLRDRGIALCTEASASMRPVGRVLLEVTREKGEPITALIRIGDNITDKRVEREMNLTGVPVDARPLAVSASADELLRASWAELLLADAPPPAIEPPDVVLSSVKNSLTPPRFQLGLQAAASWFPDLLTFGPLVQFGYAVSPRFRLVLGGHFALSPRKTSTNGAVSLSRQGGRLNASYTVWRPAPSLSFAWQLGGEFARVSLVAELAEEGALQSRVDDWTLELQTGPQAFFSVADKLQLTIGVAGVYAVQPVEATDNGEIVLSNSGPGVQLNLGAITVF